VEGFPNSFLQAWIRGVPVISTFGLDQLVRNQKLGVHVGDFRELVNATKRILIDESVLKTMSQECRRFAASHEMSIVGRRFEQLLQFA
jgi:glycosyltransferase involved in cell wall biosynthesis